MDKQVNCTNTKCEFRLKTSESERAQSRRSLKQVTTTAKIKAAAAAAARSGGGWFWLLTHEGGRGQFALVQAVDGAVGAHHASHAQTVQHLSRLDQRFASLACREFAVRLQQGKEMNDSPHRCLKNTCLVQASLDYLFEVPDAVLATEALLLAIDQEEMVGRGPAGQVVPALLAAVHDQAVGPAVNVETGVAANLMSHRLEANLVPDLLTQRKGARRKVKRLSGWRGGSLSPLRADLCQLPADGAFGFEAGLGGVLLVFVGAQTACAAELLEGLAGVHLRHDGAFHVCDVPKNTHTHTHTDCL